MDDWLKDVKAGDGVCETWRTTQDIRVVDRVTATQIVCGGRRFRRNGGYRIGAGRWDSSRLQQLTPELRDTIRHKKLASDVHHAIDSGKPKLSLGQLERIWAILQEGTDAN